jgi:hypothetical protein
MCRPYIDTNNPQELSYRMHKAKTGAKSVLEASRGTIFKPAKLHAMWIISIYIGSTHAI